MFARLAADGNLDTLDGPMIACKGFKKLALRLRYTRIRANQKASSRERHALLRPASGLREPGVVMRGAMPLVDGFVEG